MKITVTVELHEKDNIAEAFYRHWPNPAKLVSGACARAAGRGRARQGAPSPGPGRAEAKNSVTVLVPKADTATKATIDAAVAAAVETGVSKCWNGVRPPQPSLCVHDGDGVRPSDGQPYGA